MSIGSTVRRATEPSEIKRFVIFEFVFWQQSHGWENVLRENGSESIQDGSVLSFDTVEEAVSVAVDEVNKDPSNARAHVVDLLLGEIVVDKRAIREVSLK